MFGSSQFDLGKGSGGGMNCETNRGTLCMNLNHFLRLMVLFCAEYTLCVHCFLFALNLPPKKGALIKLESPYKFLVSCCVPREVPLQRAAVTKCKFPDGIFPSSGSENQLIISWPFRQKTITFLKGC